jgi:hypothetical protein
MCFIYTDFSSTLPLLPYFTTEERCPISFSVFSFVAFFENVLHFWSCLVHNRVLQKFSQTQLAFQHVVLRAKHFLWPCLCDPNEPVFPPRNKIQHSIDLLAVI